MPIETLLSSTSKYTAVALLVVLLAVCKEEVHCQSHCGSIFDDVPSRTVLAPIVFQGRPQKSHNWTQSGQIYYNFTFKVDSLFKGNLPTKPVGNGSYRSIIVGIFGPVADQVNCIGTNISLNFQYIVFLNSTVAGKNGDLNPYRISGFPERATKKIVRDVKKYAGVKYARLPTTKIQPGPLVIETVGNRLQLVCNVTGRPVPVVEWTKEGRTLQPRKGLRITETRRGSKLQISKLKESDFGSYKCQASNAVGISKSSDVHISAGQKAHSYPCPNHNYCQNNGTCFIVQTLGIHFCQCSEKFEGKRCQLKKVDFGPSSVDDMIDLQYALPVVGVGLTAIVLTSIIILVYLGLRSCWHKRKSSGKAEELSENSYRPFSLGYQGDSLTSNRGKQKSKPSTSVMKDASMQTEDCQSPTLPRRLAVMRPDGISSPHLPSHQRSKNSFNSGQTSSLQRARLNGISATPPESLAYQVKTHSLGAKFASNTKDKLHGASVIAMDESRTANETELINDIAVTEEDKRKSEYDNCWLEENSENQEIYICTNILTEQNHSAQNHPAIIENSDSDLIRNFTLKQLKP